MKNKKIVIAGGTGFIGNAIANYFGTESEIVILTRNVQDRNNNARGKFNIEKGLQQNIRLVEWNAKDAGPWCKEIDGAEIVINLAGKSVNCRYNENPDPADRASLEIVNFDFNTRRQKHGDAE